MTDSNAIVEYARRKNRLRFTFSIIVWVFYGSFALGFGPLQALFSSSVAAASYMTFALAWFFFLVVFFITLEVLFQALVKRLEQRFGYG